MMLEPGNWLVIGPVISDLELDVSGYQEIDNPSLMWFVLLVAVTLKTSFLMPPVDFALFYLKGVCPSGVPHERCVSPGSPPERCVSPGSQAQRDLPRCGAVHHFATYRTCAGVFIPVDGDLVAGVAYAD